MSGPDDQFAETSQAPWLRQGPQPPPPPLESRWHVGRELPLAVLIGLMVQTGAFIWFMSGLSSKVDFAVAQLQEFKDSRYTKADSMKDRDFYMSMIESIRQTNSERDRRFIELENMVRTQRR